MLGMKGKYPNGLAAAMARHPIGATELGRLIGTSKQNISRWADAERKLPPEWATKIAGVLDVSRESLIFPDHPDLSRVPEGREFSPDPEFDPDGGQAVAYQFDYKGSSNGSSPEIDARAGAGQGQIASERVVTLDSGGVVTGHRVVGEWILPPDMVRHEMQANPSRTWVVAVVGDSMSPTLKNGDRVFVDTMHTRLSPDGLYVIDEGDGPMVKRLHRIRDSDPPAAEIISDNEHHPRFARTLDRFRIIGRVCGRFEVM